MAATLYHPNVKHPSPAGLLVESQQYHGSAVPSNALGANGDEFILDSNGEVYTKTARDLDVADVSSLLQRLNRFPPQLCRYLARKGRGRKLMTNTDIARVAGMSRGLVCKISNLKSWEKVTISAAQRFSLACGVDLLCPCKQRRFYLNRRLVYQRGLSGSQRRMLDRIVKSLQSQT